MISRLTALLLMVVLVCAGWAAAEPVDAAPASSGPALEQSAAFTHGNPAPDAPADHHPADAAGQTLAEVLCDLPALIMAGAATPDAGLTMAAPRDSSARTPLAPYLDGPRRPPRPTARFA